MSFKNTLLLVLFMSGCTSVQVGPKRPFRTGMWKMNPELDAQKPLAPADYAAWIEQSGFLIGSPASSQILAMSIKNRKPLWHKPLKGDLTAPVFPVGEALIVAQSDGTLSKLDLQSGNTQWDLKLPSFIPVAMSKDNEHVYVVTATQVLYAISIREGKIEWLYDPELPQEIRIHNTAPPFVYINQLYWGLSSGEIIAMDSKTGNKLWRRNPKQGGAGRFHNYMGSLAISNKRLVFCRYDGLIGAVSLDTRSEGEMLWQLDTTTGNCSDSDSRSGIFYAVTTSGESIAVNMETGKNLWSGLKLGSGLNTMTAIEEYALITSTDGDIYALDHKGTVLWFDKLAARLLSHPFLFEKQACFASGLKNIYCYKI
jgi:outer membrane protein assembly factor BamB